MRVFRGSLQIRGNDNEKRLFITGNYPERLMATSHAAESIDYPDRLMNKEDAKRVGKQIGWVELYGAQLFRKLAK